MHLRTRLKPLAILAVSALAVGLGGLNLLDRASWQQAGDGIVWVETARGLEVGYVTSQQADLPVPPGALLTSVNAIPVGDLDDLTEIREFLAQSLPPGSRALYRFQDDTGGFTEYRVELLLQSTLAGIDFVLALTAIGFLAIGLFIFLRNWRALGAFHFYLICLVAFVTLLFRHSGRADTLDLVVYWFNAVAFLLLPPLFLHFSVYFPQPLRRLKGINWVKSSVYLPAAVLGTLHIAWFLGWLQPVGVPRTELTQTLVDQVELLHFSLVFLGSCFLLWWKQRQVSSPVQRQQMKWITHGGLFGTLPFVLFYGAPYLLGWPVNLAMEFSVLSLLLIPLGFGYAITRYRLMDVDLIFKRSAAYLLATSSVVGLYIGIVVVAGRFIEMRSGVSGLLPFGLGAVVVALLFAPLRSRIQESIDRRFYKERYDYRRSLSEFASTLSSETNLSELAQKVTERIRQTLEIERVGIFLRRDPQHALYDLYNPQDQAESGSGRTSLEIPDSVVRSLGPEPEALLPSLASDEVLRCRGIVEEQGFRYVQPLLVHERPIGLLALGYRADGQWLNSEDLQLIETIAPYASIALDNAVLYQALESHAAQLADLKAYNESVIQSISVGVVVVSSSGEVTIWNSRMEKIHGLSAEQAVGRDIQELFTSDLIATLNRFTVPSRWEVQDPGWIHKTCLKTTAGETRMVQITLAPLLSLQHFNAGVLLVFDDITEKTQLESQLLQAEKLSSIGLFAAGVAHEVNTPLAGISSYAQMLQKETPAGDPRGDLLRRIEQQSFRASEIVNNLLKFARVTENDFQEINLNSLMTDTVALLSHPLKKSGVGIALELDPALPTTVGSGGKLQQVFMNIFLNARDAMPHGGEVRVRTFKRKSNLVIQIRDEGEGISEENVKKIYDPFFTTKDVGKGTGLGLAVSYGIIQEHSGRINVESEPGKGTVFTLELPVKRIQ